MTKKPYPEFPLYARPRGSWAKKIAGKHCYFSRIEDRRKPALERYHAAIIESNDGRIAASQEAIEKHAGGAVGGRTWFTLHAGDPR